MVMVMCTRKECSYKWNYKGSHFQDFVYIGCPICHKNIQLGKGKALFEKNNVKESPQLQNTTDNTNTNPLRSASNGIKQ